MSDATEYRPGDIAMVDSVVCLWRDHDQSQLKPAGWYDLRGLLMPYHGRQVVGPVLGNVADIAALRGILAEVDLAHLPVQLEEARAEVATLAHFTALVEDTKRAALAEIERDTSVLMYSDPLAASVAQRFRAIIRKALA